MRVCCSRLNLWSKIWLGVNAKKKKRSNFLALKETDGKEKVVLLFLAAITASKQTRQYQQKTKSLLLLISGWKQQFQKNSVLWFLLRTSAERQIQSTWLFYFNYSHSLYSSLFPTHLLGHHTQRNPMWTFCLIKGLDTLPWSGRKAPFISSYWISVCVVSVLFNSALQFVFITGAAERVSGHPKQCHAEFKYLRLSIDRKVFARITI